jgi:hypothetical protein
MQEHVWVVYGQHPPTKKWLIMSMHRSRSWARDSAKRTHWPTRIRKFIAA